MYPIQSGQTVSELVSCGKSSASSSSSSLSSSSSSSSTTYLIQSGQTVSELVWSRIAAAAKISPNPSFPDLFSLKKVVIMSENHTFGDNNSNDLIMIMYNFLLIYYKQKLYGTWVIITKWIKVEEMDEHG